MILSVCPNPSVDTYVWVPSFEPGQANRIKKEQRYPGGKGVHVALAAAELGEEVALLGFWGGPSGQWIKEVCEKQGISCHGPETEGWSRACLTFKSDGEFDDTELLGCGPTISRKDFAEFLKTFEALVDKASCVTMSGSWPDGGPSNGYAQLIQIARTRDKRTFLDCAGDQLPHAMDEKPFAIHLNRAEGEEVFRVKDPETMANLLAKSCDFAAVTAGAEGLYLTGGDKFVHAHCAVDQVYSTIGSGDCLVAGLAVASKHRLSVEDTARLAVACGAANCIRPELGMLRRADVAILQNKTILRKFQKQG
jgi:1-phosphofructokinase family hexose kinase